jgi:hypothetical protein
MNTITFFDTDKAIAIETAVMTEMDCSIYKIIGGNNTMEKKVVVFLLTKLFGYNWRIIGRKYQITYLYVPTVVQQLQYQYKVDLNFKKMINNILKKTGYVETLD